MTGKNPMSSGDKKVVWIVGMVLFFWLGLPVVVAAAVGIAAVVSGNH